MFYIINSQLKKIQQLYREKIINKQLVDTDVNNRIPYVATYPYEQVLYTDSISTLVIEFYVTDYFQSDYHLNVFHKFIVDIKIGRKQNTIKTYSIEVFSGDNTYIADVSDLEDGDYWFSIQAIDEDGRESMRVYNDFRVTARYDYSNVYNVTDEDLITYNINKNGEYGDYILLDIPDEYADNPYLYLQTYAETLDVQDGRYICLLSDIDGDGYPDYKSAHIGQWTEGDYTSYMKFSSTYDADTVEVEALNTTNGLRNLINDKITAGYSKIVLPKGYYRTSSQSVIEIIGENVLIDFNESIIKHNKLNNPSKCICSIHGDNIHVVNAIFVGCLHDTNYSDLRSDDDPLAKKWYELGHGISITHGSKYCLFEDCAVRGFTGYGIISSASEYTEAPHPTTKWMTYSGYKLLNSEWILGDIDEQGQVISANNRYVYKNFFDISFITSEQYISINRYLGYQGVAGGSTYFKCHMYDESYNYLGHETCTQFRKFWLLPNTRYIKIVALTNIFSYTKSGSNFSLDSMAVVSHTQIINSTIKNVNVEDVRCVGITPFGKNCTLDNVIVKHSGYAQAHQLLDAEDTWELLQDLVIKNCIMIKGIYASRLLLLSGLNTCIEDSEIELSIYQRARDTVVRRCTCRYLSINNESLQRSGYVRIYDNTFDKTGSVDVAYGNIGSSTHDVNNIYPKIVINNTNTFVDTNYASGRNINNVYKNIVFNMPENKNALFLSFYDECIINNLTGRVTNLVATNCIFNNCNFTIENNIYTYEYNIGFMNCKFNNCTITNKTNKKDNELFINCIFEG